MDRKWNTNKSGWDTASVSYDISYDNIVWATPLTLIPIVPHDKIERRHSWEVPNVHSTLRKNLKTFVSLNRKQFSSFFLVTQEAKGDYYLIFLCGVTESLLCDNCWKKICIKINKWRQPIKVTLILSYRSRNVQRLLSSHNKCSCFKHEIIVSINV